MITAGVDMGSKSIKVVLVQDGEVIGRALEAAGLDAPREARQALAAALARAELERGAVHRVVATGAGRQDAPDSDRTVTEVGCAARAAYKLYPDARVVLDVGAEEGRAIRTNEAGKVVDFVINEKCAAGTGAFTESMARALELSLDELGPLSLQSTKKIEMNAQCAVFAESEVVSMIHANVARPDMVRAVHDAIASRVISMVRRVGFTPPVVLMGGLGKNVGFVDSLKRGLELDQLYLPEHVEYCVALGAALAAAG